MEVRETCKKESPSLGLARKGGTIVEACEEGEAITKACKGGDPGAHREGEVTRDRP